MAERVGGGYAVPFTVGLVSRLASASGPAHDEAPAGVVKATEF